MTEQERVFMMALLAASSVVAQTGSYLFNWHLDEISWFSSMLPADKYYDQIKAFKSKMGDLRLMRDDLSAIQQCSCCALDKDVQERIQKQLVQRPRDQWDIEIVNDTVECMDTLCIQLNDLNELLKTAPPELSKPAASLKSMPDQVKAFKDGAFTDICRAMDEESVLWLTDRQIEVPDNQEMPGMQEDEPLAIQLSADAAFTPKQQGILQKIFKSFRKESEMVPMVKDFHSKLKMAELTEEQMGTIQSGQPVQRKYHSQFMVPEGAINYDIGEATGIVMPAGTNLRRYLDGDYFPADVVASCQKEWSMNSPLINIGHEEADLALHWEHPHYAVTENYIAKSSFQLGAETVQPGDWVATIQARTPEAKDWIRNGILNGFSIEGWVSYYPEEYIVND